jgi:hypothetical protein
MSKEIEEHTGVLCIPRARDLPHIDYIAAADHCRLRGISTSELTADEWKQFYVEARPLSKAETDQLAEWRASDGDHI